MTDALIQWTGRAMQIVGIILAFPGFVIASAGDHLDSKIVQKRWAKAMIAKHVLKS